MTLRYALPLALLALAQPVLTQPALAQDPAVPAYADETASSGLTHSFTGEWTFMVGGGAAAFDCNGDLKPELYLSGGTSKGQLFRNDSPVGGALKFSPVDSGLELDQVGGAYPLDVDSDGNTDLVLLRVGPDKVMRGLGECRFEEATDWGFDGLDLWSTAFAATWEKGADWPTLAIGTYIDRTQEAFPWGTCTPNHLYRPKGKGWDAPLPLKPGFCALSILFTDWNLSGTPSLRMSNDREYYKKGQEQMWKINPGEPPALYTDKDGWARLRIWGMGIASADVTMDGYPDYFLTSMADNKLQVLAEVPEGGNPKPKFADVAFAKGAIAQRPYTGGDIRPSTAWHTEFQDVNNDGRFDIFVVKGNVWEMPDFAEKDPNNLLLQREDGTFMEAGDKAGVASFRQGRGGAVADFNLDGLMDIAVVNRNEPSELWRNTGGDAGHWLALMPVQPAPNQHAVGGWIEVKRADGAVIRRELTVGGGHAGGQLGWWHFGLGAATETEVRVLWPDGTEGPWQKVAADGFYRLARDAEPEAWQPK